MVGRSCAFSSSVTLPLPSYSRAARGDWDKLGTAKSAAVQPDLDRVDSAARIRDSASSSKRSIRVAWFTALCRPSELVLSALFRRPVQSLTGAD